MEALILPLAATALLFPLLYLAMPPLVKAWRRRGEKKRGILLSPPRKPPALVVPDASETAATVERFHRALMRTDLADFLRPDSSSGA